MISRRSTLLIAEGYKLQFRKQVDAGKYRPDAAEFYRFLYEREYAAWFCNLAAQCKYLDSIFNFVMRLHTGESIASATPEWKWDARLKHCQTLLRKLAEDYLAYWLETDSKIHHYYSHSPKVTLYPRLIGSLEIDGYIYRNSKLFVSERDVLDISEEHGVLEQLYRDLDLGERDTALHHLRLSEEHYIAKKWDDSISNSRKFLECVVMQTASKHSLMILKVDLDQKTMERPVDVREYLEKNGLVDTKEKEAFSKVYGLLSHTGSHPNMAEKDQARLLRQLSLTLAQFGMLRLQGALRTKTS